MHLATYDIMKAYDHIPHAPLIALLRFGRRKKTPTPKTRVSIWTLLRNPGRFTARPFPVYFTTRLSVVRTFSVLSKVESGL